LGDDGRPLGPTQPPPYHPRPYRRYFPKDREQKNEGVTTMHARRAFRQSKALCIVLFFTIFSSLLVACGTKSSGAGIGSVSPSATVSPFATVSGYGTDQGCPSNVVVNAAPATPDVTVGPTSGTVNTHKGAVIEVHMPFGLMWEGPTTSQGVLQLQNPYGYAWKPGKACIWRFVAKDSGTVSLTFLGRAICKKVPLCVPSVTLASFTIKVS
jgi:hypothetical protein